MATLLDTNIIARLAQPASPEYPVVTAAVARLLEAGEMVCVCPQVLMEFWSVATRPAGPPSNGLGMTPSQADAHLQVMLNSFALAYEPLLLFEAWRSLVRSVPVRGKRAHDARLAALLTEQEIGRLLTLNGRHFATFPGITVVHPASL